MSAFQWDDPFLFESQLTEEERLIRDTARRYAKDRLTPRIREANRHETYDLEVFKELGELGFFGMTLPRVRLCGGFLHCLWSGGS